MFSKIFPKIHTEGYKFIVIAVFITIIFLIINNILGLIGILLTIWVYYFFRDPERIIIGDDSYLVSPADGEVIKVEEVAHLKQHQALFFGSQIFFFHHHLKFFLMEVLIFVS